MGRSSHRPQRQRHQRHQRPARGNPSLAALWREPAVRVASIVTLAGVGIAAIARLFAPRSALAAVGPQVPGVPGVPTGPAPATPPSLPPTTVPPVPPTRPPAPSSLTEKPAPFLADAAADMGSPDQIRVGMAKSDVMSAWGRPSEIETAGNGQLGHERWVYFRGLSSRWGLASRDAQRVVYFEGGRVAGWENGR